MALVSKPAQEIEHPQGGVTSAALQKKELVGSRLQDRRRWSSVRDRCCHINASSQHVGISSDICGVFPVFKRLRFFKRVRFQDGFINAKLIDDS
jgi:hypothetical protein